MSNIDQILSVHLGQAGIQIGTAFWELICLEHGIGPMGESLSCDGIVPEYNNISSLFSMGNCEAYIPRSIFIDSEPSVIDDIKTGAYRDLFNKNMMINQIEDAANNYARGLYTVGPNMIGVIRNHIRKAAENTDNLRSFFIFNSSGGGTGSGLAPLMLLDLTKFYPKVTRIAMSIVPGNDYISALVEPYNMVLHNFAAAETVDISFLFGNESLSNICCKKLLLSSPTFTDINRILALIFNSMSCPMRYSSTIRSSVDDMLTNLIPFPKIHYPIVRYAPINNSSRKKHLEITTASLTKDLFDMENQSIKVDTDLGFFMSLILNYQGLICGNDVFKAIDEQKLHNLNKFVEWSPAGVKISLCHQIPTVSPMSGICQTDKSATMIINSTAILEFFKYQRRRFNLLFNKKSFIHWYYEEGMEDIEFNESKYDISLLIGDLNEIAKTEREIIEYMDKDFSTEIQI